MSEAPSACGRHAWAASSEPERRARAASAPRAGAASATGSLPRACGRRSWASPPSACCAPASSREPSMTCVSSIEALPTSSDRDGGWHASWLARPTAGGRDCPTCGPGSSDALTSLNPLGRPLRTPSGFGFTEADFPKRFYQSPLGRRQTFLEDQPRCVSEATHTKSHEVTALRSREGPILRYFFPVPGGFLAVRSRCVPVRTQVVRGGGYDPPCPRRGSWRPWLNGQREEVEHG